MRQERHFSGTNRPKKSATGQRDAPGPQPLPERRLPLFGRIDRYVLGHFIQSYMTAMLLITGLFMVIDMASNLDDYLEPWEDGRTVPVTVLIKYYVLNLPYLFLQVAPFITLIAGMFTVSKLLKTREVTAILGAGVSAHRMLVPLFIASIVLGIGMFFLRESLGLGVADQRDALRYVLDEQSFDETYEDLMVLEASNRVVLVDNFSPGTRDGTPPTIQGLTAILHRAAERGVTNYIRTRADLAFWDDGVWRLKGGKRTIVDLNNTSDRANTELIETLDAADFSPARVLTFNRAKQAPLELTFDEVRELIRLDPSSRSFQTLWHYHLTFPLANVILLLVGIPLMFNYERGKGSERIAIGGLLCIFYYATDFVFRTMGIQGQFSPLLAAWIPVLVFGAVGIMLYDSLRS